MAKNLANYVSGFLFHLGGKSNCRNTWKKTEMDRLFEWESGSDESMMAESVRFES